MNPIESKGSAAHYQKVVIWSEEDGCFLGQCPALFMGGVHGDDELAVNKDFSRAVHGHLTILCTAGQEMPPGSDSAAS